MKFETSDRGPLIIAGAIIVAGVFVALAVYLGSSGGDTTASASPSPFDPRASASPATPTPAIDPAVADQAAKSALQRAADGAADIATTTGSFATATTLEMSEKVPLFTYLPSTRPSDRASQISMLPQSITWAAASQSDSGTCFWIKLTYSAPDVLRAYGAGTPCTGHAAQSAKATAFPG